MSNYRWIMYLHGPIHSPVPDFERVTSLEDAKATLKARSAAAGYHADLQVNGEYGMTALLYPYTPETWREAVEFKDSGCPFDYPSWEVRQGPRGGVRVTRA